MDVDGIECTPSQPLGGPPGTDGHKGKAMGTQQAFYRKTETWGPCRLSVTGSLCPVSLGSGKRKVVNWREGRDLCACSCPLFARGPGFRFEWCEPSWVSLQHP
jgi:hypothetical protein